MPDENEKKPRTKKAATPTESPAPKKGEMTELRERLTDVQKRLRLQEDDDDDAKKKTWHEFLTGSNFKFLLVAFVIIFVISAALWKGTGVKITMEGISFGEDVSAEESTDIAPVEEPNPIVEQPPAPPVVAPAPIRGVIVERVIHAPAPVVAPVAPVAVPAPVVPIVVPPIALPPRPVVRPVPVPIPTPVVEPVVVPEPVPEPVVEPAEPAPTEESPVQPVEE